MNFNEVLREFIYKRFDKIKEKWKKQYSQEKFNSELEEFMNLEQKEFLELGYTFQLNKSVFHTLERIYNLFKDKNPIIKDNTHRILSYIFLHNPEFLNEVENQLSYIHLDNGDNLEIKVKWELDDITLEFLVEFIDYLKELSLHGVVLK